jgi:glyoxylase-like metal-dependent hydrolase (beta-lactamase superfamily II)
VVPTGFESTLMAAEAPRGTRVKVGSIVVEFPMSPSLSLPKRRAKELLAHFEGDPMTPIDAVAHIVREHSDLAAGIDRIRVTRFTPPDPSLRILQTWTKNDARVRSQLYEAAAVITTATGWYPLITGSFRWSLTGPAARYMRQIQRPSQSLPLALGEPLRLVNLTDGAEGKEGNSFLLECQGGSIQLDLGFASAVRPTKARPSLLLLSHSHADHAGGLMRFLRKSGPAPILASELTLTQLVRDLLAHRAEDLVGRLVQRAVIVEVGLPVTFADGARLTVLHANHSPGALMTLFTSKSGRTFLYTGDMALRNAYSDVGREAVDGSARVSLPRVLDWALVDAVMVGRQGAQQEESAFEAAVTRALTRRRHLVVLVDHSDVALRLYLQIYGLAMQGHRKSRDLKVYIDRKTEALLIDLQRLARLGAGSSSTNAGVDPGVARWWDAGKGLFEAYQLYMIDERFQGNIQIHLGEGGSIVVLVTPDELANASQPFSDAIRAISTRADVVVVGGRGFDNAIDFLQRQRILRVGSGFVPMKGEVTLLDGLMWGLHSQEIDLKRWITGGLAQQIGQIFLFHAPQRAILKVAWLPTKARPVSAASNLSEAPNRV